MAKKRLPMNEVGVQPSRSKGREFIVTNSGARKVDHVEVGGKRIDLHASGATIYDERLAREVKDKYKLDPNVHVMEKDHIQIKQDGSRRFTFSVGNIEDKPWRTKRN